MNPVSYTHIIISDKDVCIYVGQRTASSTNGNKKIGCPRVEGQKSQHLGGRGRQISEFEPSLVYRVSSRTARAIQRNPVLRKPKRKQTNKQTNKQRCIINMGPPMNRKHRLVLWVMILPSSYRKGM
jgi:hypothetical protein